MNERASRLVLGVAVVVIALVLGALIVGGDGDGSADVGSYPVVGGDGGSGSTVAPSTSAAYPETGPTTAPTTSRAAATTSTTTTTTTIASPASGVIVASAGVAGWSSAGAWQKLDSGPNPAVAGETYTVVRVGEDPVTVVGGDVTRGCELVDGSVYVDGLWEADTFPDFPVAVAADWDVVPHAVELLPTNNDTYRTAISETLAGQGIDDPNPELRQVVRTDLEGDGVDEIIITAGHDGNFRELAEGDYSIAVLRRVVEGEVQSAILGFFELESYDPNTDAPYLVVYTIEAVADLNGDGQMEIAVGDRYYEGAGTRIHEYVNDDLGPVIVLDVGCGA